MPTYVSLVKMTDHGMANMKDSLPRMAMINEKLESMGGKPITVYALLGEYDFMRIWEAPSDEVAMAFLLWLSTLGTARTTTMKAFSVEEFGGILKSAL